MYENLVLSNLDKKVIDSVLIGTIDSVLAMIREEASDPYYRMNSSMITTQEELSFYGYFKEDIYDNIDISMQKNNMRFIYLPNKKVSNNYIQFSLHSKVSDIDKLFTTFFIGKYVKENDFCATDFISNIVYIQIKSILYDKYNTNIDEFMDYMKKCSYTDIGFVNSLLCMIDIFICYYRAMDLMLDLKYDDNDRIIREVNAFNTSAYTKIKEIEHLCFKYAITTNHDPGDYKILCKDSASIYFNDKRVE